MTSISHMGQMRDSDWSREILLRSDWSGPRVALYTTEGQVRRGVCGEGVTVHRLVSDG